MDDKRSGFPAMVGGSSLLVIFAVLCLTVFALLNHIAQSINESTIKLLHRQGSRLQRLTILIGVFFQNVRRDILHPRIQSRHSGIFLLSDFILQHIKRHDLTLLINNFSV